MVNRTDEESFRWLVRTVPQNGRQTAGAPAVTYKRSMEKISSLSILQTMEAVSVYFEGDSPTGPWRDPIGKQLISRETRRTVEELKSLGCLTQLYL